MLSGKRPLLLLIAFAASASFLTGALLPASQPMPGYFTQMLEWADKGTIADTFTPLAYPLFGGIAWKLLGQPGLLLAGGVVHILTALLAYLILRKVEVSAPWAAGGAALLVFHPDLLTSVTKVWDAAFSTALLLLIVLALMALLRRPQRPLIVSAAAGLALGVGMSSRPNYLLLAPLLVWAATVSCRAASGWRRTLAGGLVLGAALVSFASLGIAAHGRAFFPGNGPYNLFAGHNRYSAHALLVAENAEPSIVPAYVALHGREPLPDFTSGALHPFFNQQAARFALQHPASEVSLVGLKFLTLFRPDTKVHPLQSFAGLAKAVLALPVLLFLGVLLWPGRPPLARVDRALLILDLLYIVPFLLTNSDPRFRTPLDAVLILHTFRILYLRRSRQTMAA